jgi:hypothetical protein
MISLCLSSNTVTASRECQALSTLSSFPPKLKRIILCPSLENAFPPIIPSSPTASITCPLGIPLPLWSALQQHYNPSQLSAIATICLHSAAEPMPSQNQTLPSIQSHFPFLLLQGPPGTGDFLTIESPPHPFPPLSLSVSREDSHDLGSDLCSSGRWSSE